MGLSFLASDVNSLSTAYDSTMKLMVLAATGAAIIPIILAFSMPNWYLGDTRNAVEEDEPVLDEEPLLLDTDRSQEVEYPS